MIALAQDDKVLDELVTYLKWSLSKYLGVTAEYQDEGQIELTQSLLVQRVIDLLWLEGESTHNKKTTPATKLWKVKREEIRRIVDKLRRRDKIMQ